MTDRELLELAAKAAGLNVKGEWVDADDQFTHLNIGKKFTNERMKWNPLTDDGDALRLAVKLRLHIEWRADGRVAVSQGDEFSAIYEMESSREDVLAATRRAITRAAAQMQLDKEKK